MLKSGNIIKNSAFNKKVDHQLTYIEEQKETSIDQDLRINSPLQQIPHLYHFGKISKKIFLFAFLTK